MLIDAVQRTGFKKHQESAVCALDSNNKEDEIILEFFRDNEITHLKTIRREAGRNV